MKRITITTTSFGEYDKKVLIPIEKNNFEIILNPYGRKLKREEISDLCKDSIGIIAGTETLDDEVLGKLTQLKVISRCGTGIDNVDLNAAERMGIKVLNTPDAPTLAVAELTVGFILDLLRKISQMDREIRRGQWQKRMGNLLKGKVIGIIGFGRIGRKVAELLISFGCLIKYYDINTQDPGSLKGVSAARVEMEELLRTTDIVSVHVSSKKQILGESEIRKMKNGSWLINVSRGGIIDEQALYRSLKDNHLSGAALDVYQEEPYRGPLTELDSIILTSHIGSYAKEARTEMERQAVENLMRGLGINISFL